MKRVLGIAATAVALIAACFVTAAAALAPAADAPASRVTIVLATGLGWTDVTPTSTPALWRLAHNAAIGSVNVRSRARDVGDPPSPLEGALALSAGSWAQPDFTAPAAYDATETYDASTTAAVAYRRLTGWSMSGAHVGYLGLPAAVSASQGKSADVVLGTLGQAVRDAGGLTAAIGNSDAGTALSGQPKRMRPAAVVAMDAHGLVGYGDVSADLLEPAPLAPYGWRTDLSAFDAAFARVDAFARGHHGPSLIVLDPGDGYRAIRFSGQVTDEVAARQRTAALRTLDAVVAAGEKRRGDDGVLIVTSQALYSDASGLPSGIGPIVVVGKGYHGLVTSASTHRAGLVTAPDITATALKALGVAVPVQVSGDAMLSGAAPAAVEARKAQLMQESSAATSVDAAKAGVLNTYIALVLIVFALTGFAIARAPHWSARFARRVVAVLKAAVLLVLAAPVSSWLMFLVVPHPATATTATMAFVLTAAVVWLAALLAARWWPVRVPAAVLSLFSAAVLLADQLFGAPLSFTGLFGYSPLLAARFYGMGNEAAALCLGASVIGSMMLLDQWPDAKYSALFRRWGIAVMGVVVVGVTAAPFLGANVGVAIWGLAGFVLAWMLANGHRFGWKAAVATVLLVVLVIGAFSAIDLLGGGEQTHLGRALTSAEQGGASQLTQIIVRKAQTNARVFSRTNWSWILVAALALLGFLRYRSKPDFADMLAENRYLGVGIVVTLVAGVIAFFSEDSGIVIPALIMLYTGSGVAWMMLSRVVGGANEEAA